MLTSGMLSLTPSLKSSRPMGREGAAMFTDKNGMKKEYSIVARSLCKEIAEDTVLKVIPCTSDTDAKADFWKYARKNAGKWRCIELVKHVEFQDDDGEYVIDDIVLESVATEYKPGRA